MIALLNGNLDDITFYLQLFVLLVCALYFTRISIIIEIITVKKAATQRKCWRKTIRIICT